MTSFILIWALWFLSEILTNRLLRSGKVESKESDKGSIHVIWMTIGAANTAGILLVIFLPLPYGYSMVPAYSGLALIVIGMCIRFLSIRALGPFFTVNVAIHSDHRLKTDGIYRLVRHPSYSGSLVSFLGFGLSLNNWLSTILIMALVSSAFLYRIRIEEEALFAEFGDEFLVYRKKTYRLIPWIY